MTPGEWLSVVGAIASVGVPTLVGVVKVYADLHTNTATTNRIEKSLGKLDDRVRYLEERLFKRGG